MARRHVNDVVERELRLLMAAGERPRAKKRKPRQEISACIKWLCFLLNFAVFLVGVAILALGIYLFIKDFNEFKLMDLLFNPAVLLSFIGFIICIVSMMGFLGALRENIFLLKSFALCVFLCYIIIVILTMLLFLLFYSDTTDGLSAHSVLLYGIRNYHTNRNLAELVDALQENLQCCGVSSISQGYRDWNLSYQFNCSTGNPQPEKCGVPYSCCKKSVISEAAGSSNPLLPAMRSLECWQNALNKRPQDLDHDLHTRGCFQPLKTLFDAHAIHIGGIVAACLLPVFFSVCLTNILAKQIDHQIFLLEREARRDERRRKRERHDKRKHRDRALEQVENGNLPPYDPTTPPKLPDNPPPPRPPVDKGKSRATSLSPTRVALTPQKQGQKRERRKRSTTTPRVDSRVHQWVLQQSDLVPNKEPSP